MSSSVLAPTWSPKLAPSGSVGWWELCGSASEGAAELEGDGLGDAVVGLGVDALTQAGEETFEAGGRQGSMVRESPQQVQVLLCGVSEVDGEPLDGGLVELVGLLDAVLAGDGQVLQAWST